MAAGFGISVGTAHAYTAAVIALLADRAPGLLWSLHEADPDYVLLDGTLAECDRVGDSRADFSDIGIVVLCDPNTLIGTTAPKADRKSLPSLLLVADELDPHATFTSKLWSSSEVHPKQNFHSESCTLASTKLL